MNSAHDLPAPDQARRESILVVEDTPASLRLLAQMLEEQGYHVRPVRDGALALAAAKAAPPDLILLDIRMPGMSGYEVCAALKEDPTTRDIPIIFISALDEIQDKVKAFASGGVDYVTKPYQLEEVLARVRAHLTLRRLQRELQAANRRMEQELALAGEIQASLLPAELPALPGWDMAAVLRPARETSGDFYDVIPLPDGRYGILIADVVDKGVKAALFMALSWALIRTYAREYPSEPEMVMASVNRRIVRDTRSDQFLSAFYGVLDPAAGTLTYANAGHNPPFLFRHGEVHKLRPTGMILGILEGAGWGRAVQDLLAGDALLLYTDGVTDASNSQGGFFEEQGLLAAAQAVLALPAPAMQNAVLAAIDRFAGGVPQFDDIAMIVLKRA